MGTVQNAVIARLADELERRTEWDEYPVLYRIHLSGGRPRLVEMRTDPRLWEADRPPAVLTSIAATVAANRIRSPTPDLFGVAFRHEGWKVDLQGRPLDRAEVQRVHATAVEHKLYTRPDRQEMRIIYAVDRAGVSYQSELIRGQATASREVFYPGADGIGRPLSVGAVPDALDLMVQTLTGIPAEARNEPPEWLKGS